MAQHNCSFSDIPDSVAAILNYDSEILFVKLGFVYHLVVSLFSPQ